jgi:tRNA nucleotidyltransferase (CCA-adding enzyme)
MVAAGFVPVGRDFPVFLHPRTKQGVTRWRALSARPRRATTGFAFHAAADVTLEEDLRGAT